MIAPRKAIAGTAVIAALALAGCHPPHENPSEEKIDTATSQDPSSLKGGKETATPTNVVEAQEESKDTGAAVVAEDGTPMLNNCGETGLVRPTELTLDCKKQDDFLEDIVWDEWGQDLAVGTATRVVRDPDNREEGVQVVLGSPQIVNDELVFTTASVNGIPINPESNY